MALFPLSRCAAWLLGLCLRLIAKACLPFNISDRSGKLLAHGVRCRYGTPPPGNANYPWIQHIDRRGAGSGTAGEPITHRLGVA